MKSGSLVIPKISSDSLSDTIYLTPRDNDDAENFEKWIEWRSDQFGIIIEISKDFMITVFTLEGTGTCFHDELTVVGNL